MKKYPKGYPLKPNDNEGNILKEGDIVKIITIPEYLYKDLDNDEAKSIKSCEGEIMKIHEVDDYGFMWVEKPILETENDYESHRFSIEPVNLLKSSKTSNK